MSAAAAGRTSTRATEAVTATNAAIRRERITRATGLGRDAVAREGAPGERDSIGFLDQDGSGQVRTAHGRTTGASGVDAEAMCAMPAPGDRTGVTGCEPPGRTCDASSAISATSTAR